MNAKQCGAKTRSGEPCKKWGMKNGRCRLHGGASTGTPGRTNARTHGIYVTRLTVEEQADYAELELGSVDHELRLTRVRLARALDAEKQANGDAELDEVTENEGGGAAIANRSVKRKVRDYISIIDKLTARIESLERTRNALDAGDGENADIMGFETRPYAE